MCPTCLYIHKLTDILAASTSWLLWIPIGYKDPYTGFCVDMSSLLLRLHLEVELLDHMVTVSHSEELPGCFPQHLHRFSTSSSNTCPVHLSHCGHPNGCRRFQFALTADAERLLTFWLALHVSSLEKPVQVVCSHSRVVCTLLACKSSSCILNTSSLHVLCILSSVTSPQQHRPSTSMMPNLLVSGHVCLRCCTWGPLPDQRWTPLFSATSFRALTHFESILYVWGGDATHASAGRCPVVLAPFVEKKC